MTHSKLISILASLILLTASFTRADENVKSDIKSTAKDVGHTFKKAGKDVGHTFKKVGKDAGHAGKQVGQTTAHRTKKVFGKDDSKASPSENK